MPIYKKKIKLTIIASAIISSIFSHISLGANIEIKKIDDIENIEFRYLQRDPKSLAKNPNDFYQHGQLNTSLRDNLPSFLISKHASIVMASSMHGKIIKTLISYDKGYNFEELIIDGVENLRLSSLSDNGQYAIVVADNTVKNTKAQLFLYDTHLKKIFSITHHDNVFFDKTDYLFSTQDSRFSLYTEYDFNTYPNLREKHNGYLPYNKIKYAIYDHKEKEVIPFDKLENSDLNNHIEKERFNAFRKLDFIEENLDKKPTITSITLDGKYIYGDIQKGILNPIYEYQSIAYIYDTQKNRLTKIFRPYDKNGEATDKGESKINAVSKNNIFVGWYESFDNDNNEPLDNIDYKDYEKNKNRLLVRQAFFIDPSTREGIQDLPAIQKESNRSRFRTNSEATDISDDSRFIVGWSEINPPSKALHIRRAFIYDRMQSAASSLELLPNLINGNQSEAFSISGDGSVVYGVAANQGNNDWKLVSWRISKDDRNNDIPNNLYNNEAVVDPNKEDAAQEETAKEQGTSVQNVAVQPTQETETQERVVPTQDAVAQPTQGTEIKKQPESTTSVVSQPTQGTEIKKQPESATSVVIQPTQGTEIKKQPESATSVVIQPTQGTEIKKQPESATSVVSQPTQGTEIKKQPESATSVVIQPTQGTEIKKQPESATSVVSQSTQETEIKKQPESATSVVSQPTQETEIKKQPESATSVVIQPTQETEIKKQPESATSVVIQPTQKTKTQERVVPAQDAVVQPAQKTKTQEQDAPVEDVLAQRANDKAEEKKKETLKPSIVISKPIDIENTYKSMQISAENGYKLIDMQQSQLRYLTSAICSVGSEKACISGFTHYQHSNKANATQTGLSGAYRVDIRNMPVVLGLAIDTDVYSSLPKGYQYQGYPLPLIGFSVDLAPSLNPGKTNNALHLSLKGAYLNRKVSIERQALENTESGKGNAKLAGYHIELQSYYPISIDKNLTLTPFAGMTFNNVSRSAYTETQNAQFAAHYEKLNEHSLMAKLGLGADYTLTSSLSLNAKAGMYWQLSQKQRDFRSQIDYLGQQNIEYAGSKKTLKQRPFTSVGLTYQFDKHSSVGTNTNWEMTPYHNHDLQFGINYAYRF